MNIGDVELYLVELPARGGPVRSLVVRLASEAGFDGWGETRKAWRAGELAARRKALLSVLAGREVFDVESILALDALADRAVACAVEMALWDLIARGSRLPLCHLLGGGYRRRVPLAARLPEGSPEVVAEAAKALAAQTIRSLVVTTTGSIEEDLRLIRAVRHSCPERVRLRLDCQGQYSLEQAAQLCDELDGLGVQFVLDPVGGDLERLAMLNGRVRVPLAALAGIGRPSDVVQAARLEAASFVVVDPVRVGGLARARACATVAEAAGLSPCIRLEQTSGLAVAASLQLAAATPAFIGGHDCSYPKLEDDLLREPLSIVDGMLGVPSAAGLGVEVDREKLERYAQSG